MKLLYNKTTYLKSKQIFFQENKVYKVISKFVSLINSSLYETSAINIIYNSFS